MEKARTTNIPIYFFRFEDLLITPEPVLKNMFCHILGAENLDGTIAERRIRDVIKTGKNFLYKPRSAGGSALHKHPDKLSETQMQMMMDKLEFYLHFFGYASDGEEPFDGTDPSKAKFPINCGFYNYHGKAK